MSKNAKAQALAFLRAHTTGTLATSSKDGQPHASTVFYTADKNFNLHLLCLADSRKFKAVKKNQKVAFSVYEEGVPQTLQMEGVAEVVSEREKSPEADKLINIQMQHSKVYFAPMVKMDRGEIELIRIRPTWIRWADYSVLDKTGNDNVWTEIPVPRA